MTPDPRPLRVLLVEDDAGDVLLVREAFADSAMATALEVVSDGVEAGVGAVVACAAGGFDGLGV